LKLHGFTVEIVQAVQTPRTCAACLKRSLN